MGVVLGITGGIATGKTTVTEMFRKLGADVLSADEVARDVLAPGSPASEEVARRFGASVLASDGSIDRQALADVVFRDEEARETLNAITHPRIIAVLEERAKEFREPQGRPGVLVLEIPLLIECGLEHTVDKVVVVAAEQETQMSRLTTRGLTDEQARQRVAAQMPTSEKVQLADWVITTDGGLEDTRRQVDRIWKQVGELTDHS